LHYGREQYATYFDPSVAKLYEIDYHHAMPWKPVEVEKLADKIKDIYRSTKYPNSFVKDSPMIEI
jgi:hypothetical protein